jgi:hypothetical protein
MKRSWGGRPDLDPEPGRPKKASSGSAPNADARKALAVLHRTFLDMKHRNWSLTADASRFQSAGLEEKEAAGALRILTMLGLAEKTGPGSYVITPHGETASTDRATLDLELPLDSGEPPANENAPVKRPAQAPAPPPPAPLPPEEELTRVAARAPDEARRLKIERAVAELLSAAQHGLHYAALLLGREILLLLEARSRLPQSEIVDRIASLGLGEKEETAQQIVQLVEDASRALGELPKSE